MNKLLQIEQALLRLDQATFQKLCAAYFQYEYENYNVKEIGSSHGQNTTTTGTPDILIDCKNGKYFFVECTVQKEKRTKKFLGDITNCFDINKTKISVQDVKLIILCHNTKSLTKAQKQPLINAVHEQNCEIQFVDIDELKFALYKNYSRLAQDFLGIEVDTQQILAIPDFIKEQERKATSLQNDFFGRENDLKDIKDLLQTNNIIVLTGKAGVGKTRLAIETFKQFKQDNPNYEFYGIDNKGIPIWNDLHVHFLPNHKYLVLIDDANRIADFKHIASLSISENRKVKIIITVRDYALEKILRILNDNKYPYKKRIIPKLKSETIKEILASLRVTNPLCVDNITRISNGIPRLVLMAADFVLQDDDCQKLRNVVDIYDEYFSKTIDEINELSSSDTLKVLGIICFFRIINKEYVELNEVIFSVFEIEENNFWKCIFQLHEIELVDMYEKEIVKISDQNIATYFFYYVFIKKQLLDYSTVLTYFLDKYPYKVKENFNPLLEYFDSESIMRVLNKGIDKKLQTVKNEDTSFINFMKVFWFCRKEELLHWLQDKITYLEPDTSVEYDFLEPQNNHYDYYNDEYLELLKLFGQQHDEYFRLSLEVLFDYIQKNPKILPKVLKYFKEELYFTSLSCNQEYKIQIELFELLFDKVQKKDSEDLAKRIILAITNRFLQFHYQVEYSSRNNKEYDISQQIKNFREKVWRFLLENYIDYPKQVLKILNYYITQIYPSGFRLKDQNKHHYQTSKIIYFDEPFILEFFENYFKNDNYIHCELFHKYLKLALRSGKELILYKSLKSKFTSTVYKISQKLEWDYFKRRSDGSILSAEEFYALKKQELKDAFGDYKYEDYVELLKVMEQFFADDITENNGWHGKLHSFEIILINLAEENVKLCLRILKHLFATGNRIRFSSERILWELLTKSPDMIEQIYDLVFIQEYSNKNQWQLNYYSFLPLDKITQKTADEILELYNKLESNLNLRFEYLNNYKHIQDDILVQVIKLLLSKSNSSDFKFKFNCFSFFKEYIKEFKNNLHILKQLYLYTHTIESSFDYKGKAIKAILELDRNFIIEFLQWKNINRQWQFADQNHIDFSFLWELEGYEQILEDIFEYYVKSDNFYIHLDHYINAFFPNNLPITNLEHFVDRFIKINSTNTDKIRLLFNVVTHSYPGKRIEYLAKLLKYNQEVNFIRKLTLINNSKSYSGSIIPLYEKDKEFWKEVEKVCSSNYKLLKIKLWAKEQQNNLDRQIEGEAKRDFMYDD